MKSLIPDENSIINILARRTNRQRLQISAVYENLYGKDLVNDLKFKLGGNFEHVIVSMMTPFPEFYAKEFHDAVNGLLGPDEDALIEILCTMSNKQIRAIKDAYQKLYKKSLEEDLREDTTGEFKNLLLCLCNANRHEHLEPDPVEALRSAEELLIAGNLRLGNEEATFNRILAEKSHAQLALIFEEYERLSGQDIEEAIKSEFDGDVESGFLAVVRASKHQPNYFARQLHHSVQGLGTKDKVLIRNVITRSEIDMKEIKEAFATKFGRSLEEAIKTDVSGAYKNCLLVLIGED